MKDLLFFLFSINISLAFSQSEKLDYLSKLPPVFIDSVHWKKSDTLVFIRFEFAKATLLDKEKISQLNNRTILKIDLVYTTYVELPSFNQYKLNYSRFNNLLNEAPFLAEQDFITWRILGSTAWKSEDEAKKLFSGFIFHLRPVTTKKETEKEIAFLKRRLHPELSASVKKHGKAKVHSYVFKKKISKRKSSRRLYCYSFDTLTNAVSSYKNTTYLYSKIRRKPRYKGGEMAFYNYISKHVQSSFSKKLIKKKYSTGIYSFDLDGSGKMFNIAVKGGNNHPGLDSLIVQTVRTMPDWQKGNTNGLILNYNFIVNFTRKKVRVNYSPKGQHVAASNLGVCNIIDTTKNKAAEEFEYMVSKINYAFHTSFIDTTVTCIFNRNPQWKNMLVVADLTGSMSPYTEQLLVWFKLGFIKETNHIQHLTFFNDGDNKNSDEKLVGYTGGIYHADVKDKSFEAVEKLALETMLKGGGGDCPENNLEAVIEGINACTTCEEVVMIADNFATPRDMELIAKIARPVKVILCGTGGGINTKYLDFVRKNKGSLHIIEKDILDLMKLNEGKSIEINGFEYQVKNDKFFRVF